ncbi:hypothetical protein GQ42DRAFT_163914 [Ramicandelaber brevisporus]|nr:hypothetical protein GQ42DRAFT_163914 [Ramicandelaber brevisporus]
MSFFDDRRSGREFSDYATPEHSQSPSTFLGGYGGSGGGGGGGGGRPSDSAAPPSDYDSAMMGLGDDMDIVGDYSDMSDDESGATSAAAAAAATAAAIQAGAIPSTTAAAASGDQHAQRIVAPATGSKGRRARRPKRDRAGAAGGDAGPGSMELMDIERDVGMIGRRQDFDISQLTHRNFQEVNMNERSKLGDSFLDNHLQLARLLHTQKLQQPKDA